jgi:hypothetical protein
VIPLYGFLAGDTLGLLVLADEADTVARLAERLQDAASVRVRRRAHVAVSAHGHVLDGAMSLREAGLTALDRFDVTEVER